MTRVVGDWVSAEPTQAVFRALTDAGHKAYFVGGCVRNALIGASVSDIDISTDARPDRVMELVESAGLKAVPTGIDHGTVTVVSGGIPHEITTFRRDIETDGRRAVVAYSDAVIDDARRRDFTINAIYASADGTVLDPLDGLPDLEARRIRFIEDADRRIKEDYLRILRFFRFYAWYGDPAGGMDAEGLAACAANISGIASLSKERIGAEMKKLLSAPDPAPAVAAMQHTGVIQCVLPGSDAKALSVLVHVEQETKTAPDPIRRLAALGGNGQGAALRLSRDEARKLDLLVKNVGQGSAAAVLGYKLGEKAAFDVCLLNFALLETVLPPKVRLEIQRGAKAVFPIKAADLMPDLIGETLGAHLNHLESEWIASDFKLTKKALLS
ncbi:CCA tRNA nucleotidyltransferase [Pseudohalocynthiibacter sp. F2068]|uniref:CCA tRNA nucleotidyltransferase n=1 Tax=Pseudohalocynthiibacter sp. F2068 TaxID=2926418 RepID=UPI001FF500CD|nr:CCA tRNA nucleotidyltransferase [Pseudohalocynthiibacter sp. F2068]MCK0102831.1 CCA tRNA nucleotidyltransferase [Pseudohalocynthiibacter sp. F2068]